LTSTYVTADAAELFLAAADTTNAKTAVEALRLCKNPDGGCGVCSGDLVSRVRPTCVALRATAKFWRHGLLGVTTDSSGFERAVKWLVDAHNDLDGGWADLPSTPNSNLSATADALDGLAIASAALRDRPLGDLRVRNSVIERGMAYLTAQTASGIWSGPPEQVTAFQIGNRTFSHVVSGLGPTMVCMAVARLVSARQTDPNRPLFSASIDALLAKCKPIPNQRGQWIVPSDQGGAPLAWNSAFAVEALSLCENAIADLLAFNLVETPIIRAATRKLRIWRGCSAVLATVLVAVSIVASGVLNSISAWFAARSALVQGLLLTVAGLLIEGAVAGVRTIWRRMSLRKA
jgi:hypothetical protein